MSLQSGTGFLWSHHQKFVIVDRQTAFVGGLDLAYTRYNNSLFFNYYVVTLTIIRWDTQAHSITDEKSEYFPQADYYNSLYKYVIQILKYLSTVFLTHYYRKTIRGVHPRMGWHDVHILVGTMMEQSRAPK